jgi:endonuclease/exonuclease/phosphatase family metal-dependent hydrolase
MPTKSTPIQIVTWNVHFQGARILDALKGQPDVLTLQEVTFNQRADFEERLIEMGLKCCPDSQPRGGGKDYGNLIACRWTIEPVEARFSGEKPPWAQLLVQASVSVNGRSFLVISVHIPNGSGYGWRKIDTFNALKDAVREAKCRPCILTGDFNEPQYIPLQDGGRIVTWGQWWDADQGCYVCTGTWKDRSGRSGAFKQWDAAVRWIFEEHNEHGMQHAYWKAHGQGVMPVSHVSRGQPRWFDHMFVSPHFCVEICEYLHELRVPGLSDHSALKAKLLLKG